MTRSFYLPGLLLLLTAGWWSYSPGFAGTFLFDDFNNLGNLGTYGGVHDVRSLLLYLTSGNADPTGRPLSLLSFLIDARDWPADPLSFKHTNVLLHLLNGLLLSQVLLKLGRRIGLAEVRAQAAALLGSSLWTLHPLLVSTTLYVVQREAMLPATFSLIGMQLWLSGRERLRKEQHGAIPLLIAGAWGCTILAVLCKANGILLPLLILVTEWTLPDSENDSKAPESFDKRLGLYRRYLLAAPSGALALWLISKFSEVIEGTSFGRPWTLGQRLLTEPRVVCDYLRQLWIPRASGSSLFNDDYAASVDLLHPWSTLPAIVAIALLIGAGFGLRRKHPALAFAILFFFAGHLLESTLLPLELYFEHRNYLPAMPMFWPLAIWLTGTEGLRSVRYASTALLLLILAALCHVRAGIWGKPLEQALLLAQINPESPRAQANAATYELAHGAVDQASHRLEAATARMPSEVQLTLNWVNAECATGVASSKAINAAVFSLKHNHNGSEFAQNWIVAAIDSTGQRPCKGLDLDTLGMMTQAIGDNPDYGDGPSRQIMVLQLKGRLALARGDGPEALSDFDQALVLFATPDRALEQAALLGNAGFPSLGLKHLALYRTLTPADRQLHGMAAIHAMLLEREGYWSSEFSAMESQMLADAQQRALTNSTTTPATTGKPAP